jgi:hypothetical protein
MNKIYALYITDSLNDSQYAIETFKTEEKAKEKMQEEIEKIEKRKEEQNQIPPKIQQDYADVVKVYYDYEGYMKFEVLEIPIEEDFFKTDNKKNVEMITHIILATWNSMKTKEFIGIDKNNKKYIFFDFNLDTSETGIHNLIDKFMNNTLEDTVLFGGKKRWSDIKKFSKSDIKYKCLAFKKERIIAMQDKKVE